MSRQAVYARYRRARTFTASYDADGRMASMALPGGVRVSYEYDETGA
ncbi:MAG TPA: RHS repeat domain-containing protein [Micromonosporaceae bacterium]